MSPTAHVFPPAMVPALRERLGSSHPALADVTDEALERVVTTVFFAGLETNEGERKPVRVAFGGTSAEDLILPRRGRSSSLVYRWTVLRFASPRPFDVEELAKLSIVTADERLYVSVAATAAGIEITGLAREGFNEDDDPFVEVVAARPGALSVHSGGHRVVEYDRGVVVTVDESAVFVSGPVREALERSALAAGFDLEAVEDYLGTVRALVRAVAAHGRGGILVVASDDSPELPEGAAYRVLRDGLLSPMLRLSRLLSRVSAAPEGALAAPGVTNGGPSAYARVLRSAFAAEAQRTIEQIGSMSAVDGATVLNRSLALAGFGVILPVAPKIPLEEAENSSGLRRLIDLGSRGTRHRAGATWAWRHPGSVVFVASQDGQVRCMLHRTMSEAVLVWKVDPRELHAL